MNSDGLRLREASVDESKTCLIISNSQLVIPSFGGISACQWTSTESQSIRRYRGYDTPHFRKRVKDGELVPPTHWHQVSIIGNSIGTLDAVVSTDGVNFYHSWCPGNYCAQKAWMISVDDLETLSPALPTYLVTSAAASIMSSSFDALTFAAELREASEMFWQAWKNLQKLSRRGMVPPRWRRFTSAWLAQRYGWMPFIRDIKSIINLVRSMTTARASRHKGHARGQTSHSVSRIVEDSECAYWRNQTIVSDSVEVALSGCVVADIAVPTLTINPIQTGWELIPFSFVIDWFVNVGKTITALSVLNSSTNIVSACGYRLTLERFMERKSYPHPPYWKSGTLHEVGKCTGSLTVRSPCSIPIFPQFDMRINPTRITDAVCLILQCLK